MSVGRWTAIRALVTAGVSAAALAFTAAPSVALLWVYADRQLRLSG